MKRASRIILIGAGGHGSELFSYLKDLTAQGQKIQCVGFVDEHEPRGTRGDWKILGGVQDLKAFLKAHSRETFYYLTAAGDNKTREEFVRKVGRLGARNLLPWTLRHPRSAVGDDVRIGEGSCLAPGSVVTTRVTIGKHCILNVNASVSHDCVIGDFVNINPGAVVCGNVQIGQGCYIGAGATVIDKISIGDWTIIGAGAVVVENIPSYVTAVGVPARIIKRHAAG